MIRFQHPASLLRRAESFQATLIAIAFWTLAVITLTNLRYLHLWGLPSVEVVIARVTIVCCVLLLGLVGARRLIACRKSGSLAPIRGALGGTPGLLLFAAVASYLAIGAAVLGVEAISQPETAGSLKYRVLQFGVLVAAAVGGRAALEGIGADRLLQGVLVVLILSCVIILASPVLRDLDILPPYRIPFRLTGAFVNPNDAGLAACMTVALAVALLTNGGPRTLGWLGLAAGVAASLATASRTALVVLGAVAVVFLLISVRSKPRPFVLALAATGLIGIAGFIGVGGFSGSFSKWSELRFIPAATYEGNLFCDPSPTDNPGADCAVLLAKRDILAGDIVLNWSSVVPVNYWQGVTVAGSEGRVTGLNLAGLGLNGRIPAELGRLDRLVSLSLQRNQLTGRIPPELGNLARLEYLNLSHNALTGGIPPELAKLKNLKELWLKYNRLTGAVPVALGELGLSLLRLSGNDFDSIPPELTAVADHDLAYMCVSTPLPPMSPALSDDCKALLAVKETLAGNASLNWHAAVPVGLWQGVTVAGSEGRVTGLNLAGLGLNGRIPAELGRLDRLVSLSLQRNQLTGRIPPELGNLARLEYLNLSHNALTGGIPPELAKFKNLKELWLKHNRLTGAVPVALGELGLSLLRLSGNDFDSIPPELTAAADHDLAYTRVSTPLPPMSPALSDDCKALLAVKETLAGNASLNWHAAVPVGLWQGVTMAGPEGRVTGLNLAGLRLNGRIPPELGNLARLEYLNLSHNTLTGGIPPELGKLTGLRTLMLAGNALTGAIPPEIANLPNLGQLWLADNHLTGSFASALTGIKHLSLAVAGNDFHGCLPWGLRHLHLHSHDIDDDLICDALAIDRLLLWRLGFEKALESLVFGHGLGALAHMDGAPIGIDGRPLGAHNLYLALLGEAGIVPLLLFVSAIVLLLRAQWGAPKSLARDATIAWVIVIALYSMSFQHLLVISAFMFLAGLSVATGAPPIDGDCHVVET